jgi:hypothetical protein
MTDRYMWGGGNLSSAVSKEMEFETVRRYHFYQW